MDVDHIDIPCWDAQCTGTGHFLIVRIKRHGSFESKVTYICPFHQDRYKYVVGGDGSWWTDDMITSMMGSVERGRPWADITKELNSVFGTTFSGEQRPDGKGYRGDVSRKFSRMAKIDWIPGEPHSTLLPKIRSAFSTNNKRATTSHERGTIPDD